MSTDSVQVGIVRATFHFCIQEKPAEACSCKDAGLTLVTYDQRTIAPLLKSWAEAGISHGGVIFVDERTVAPNDFGGLVRAMLAVFEAYGQANWIDWVIYLTPPALA